MKKVYNIKLHKLYKQYKKIICVEGQSTYNIFKPLILNDYYLVSLNGRYDLFSCVP
ncbi:hypothetical protein [Spiroplasma corruscae]|uniref:hypothetical protein n=1 Tax=Spiroplasma corruscae TaxID=216934 RepID=UPI0012FDC41A|nr:hypothetical protein [Spiroplasma corruscae]